MKKIIYSLIFIIFLLMMPSFAKIDDNFLMESGDGFNIINTSAYGVTVWGNNDYGQCNVPDMDNIVMVSAGHKNVCALDENNKAYVWGDNTYNQCNIDNSLKYKCISSGETFTALLTVDGDLKICGHLDFEPKTITKSISKIASGDDFVALLYVDGTVDVICSDTNLFGNINAENAVDIDAGNEHFIVMCNDGSIYAYGDNTYGQCNIPEDAQASYIKAGDYHNLYLDKNGKAHLFGANFCKQCDINTDKKILAASLGYDNTVLLTCDGKLLAYGDNTYGQCVVPDSIGNIKSINAAMDNYSIIDTNNNAYIFGSNNNNKSTLSKTSEVKKIVQGANHTLVLYNDGSIKAFGSNNYGQCDVPSTLNNVSDIAAGYDFCLALQNGKVYGWGYNTYNQCTIPTINEEVISIDCGFHHSVCLTKSGKVIVWGQHGEGYCNQELIPDNMGKIVKIKAGAYYTLALDENGKVYGWGYNREGQSSVPAIQNASDIYAGAFVSCIKSDDYIFFGDENMYGNAPDNIKLLSLGYYNNFVVNNNDDLIVFGSQNICIPGELFKLNNKIVSSSYFDVIPKVDSDNPLILEAENYDVLGEDISYYDTTKENSYGYYRNDDVEITVTGKFYNSYCVSMANTEWLNYTFECMEDGEYDFFVNHAGVSNALLEMYVDDGKITSGSYIIRTGKSNAFDDSYVGRGTVTKGVHILKIKVSDGYFAVDNITIEKAQNKAYKELFVPGIIKPYQYNIGGYDVGYSSPLRLNNGLGSNKVRPYDYISMVNLSGFSTENIVSSFQPRDWLSYDVNVKAPGKYKLYLTYQGNGNANQIGKINVYKDGELKIENKSLGNATSLTEILLGEVDFDSPKATLRIENPIAGNYGYILGNMRFELEEYSDLYSLDVTDSNGEITANVKYANISGNGEKFYIIIAQYNKNKLDKVDLQEYSQEPNSYKEYEFKATKNENSTVSVFLWDELPGNKIMLKK